MAKEESQVTTDVDFAQEMASLLDQHDYESPKVGDIRNAIIVSMSQQGIIVDLGLKRDGIIQPADLEKLEPEERESLAIDDEIPVYILSTDEQDSLLVSLHMARMNEDWIQAQELLDSGEVIEVEISGHNRGGALAPFGRLRGFIPASHLTFLNPGMSDQDRQRRMAKAHGEKIPVKVIEVDRRRRRLVLSHREAERVWQDRRRRELMETLQEGDVVTGRVSGWRDFGAFVDLGGADGLIHLSELSWSRVNHPNEVIQVGDEVQVYVLNVDRERKRIGLSLRRLEPEPWSVVHDRYAVGQIVEGVITKLASFGAFARVDGTLEGLIHISELANHRVTHPREVVKEGDTLNLRIIRIDPARRRMGLSLKRAAEEEYAEVDWRAAEVDDEDDDAVADWAIAEDEE